MADPEEFTTVRLPNGSTIRLPNSLSTAEKNRIIQDSLVQTGAIDEPKRVSIPMPWQPNKPLKVKESTARLLTNIPGEMAASVLAGAGGAALGATPPGLAMGGPGVLGMAGRALGAPLGRKLISEPLQKAMGVPPQPMGLAGAAGLAGMAGAGELAGLGASKAIRGGLGLFGRIPGRASQEETRYMMKLYREAGVDPPSASAITQSKMLQGAFGYAQKSLYSSGVTNDALRIQEEHILQTILGRTAKTGTAFEGRTAQEVGRTISTGPRRAKAAFESEARQLFNEARRLRPADLTVTLDRAMDQLDSTLYEHVVDIASAAGGTKIASIAQRVQRAIAGGNPVLFEDLERLRSFVGRQIGKTLGTERGELKTFYGRLTDDMEQALDSTPGVDPAATTAWRAARNHYKKGIEKVDDFYATINKKVTPEEVTYELDKYITGKNPNPTRLKEIKSTLTPDEWGEFQDWFVRRNLVTPDGKRFLGFPYFLDKAEKWDDQMMDLVFDAGSEKHRWMSNLKDIARNEAEYGAGGVQRNPLMIASEIVGPVAGAAGVVAAKGNPFLALITLGAYPIGMNSFGRLLSSDTFLKWVVEGAKMTPNKWASHIGSLAGIAEYEDPEVQEALLELVQNMKSGMTPGPSQFPGPGLLGGR